MNTICLRNIKKQIVTQKEKYLKLKKQRGMTLLEIIIVLGIVGTIAAGVVVLAQRAYDSKAISDLVNNTNVVRTAMKEAYGRTGSYPVLNANNVTGLTDATINTTLNAATAAAAPPIQKLFQMGKISLGEARNNVSGDFFNTGGALIDTIANKGYVVVINGLDQKQCRSVLNQVANNWDYVEIIADAPAGTNPDFTGDLTDAAAVGGPILRSLADAGNVNLSPDVVVQLCADNGSNGIVLGSR